MKKSAGFTIVEVAMVVLVGGLMLTAATSTLNNSLNDSRITLTQTRMQEIESAISEYLSVNGVLPCPAKLNDAPDTANFGLAINATDPNACAASAGAGTFITAGVNAPPTNVVIGAVPVRTLNLPDQDMIDGWGSRFIFAVTAPLTAPNEYNPAEGAIGLLDNKTAAGTAIVGPASGIKPPSYAQYVIVSHGANRAGAYTLSGGQGVPCPTAAANPYESKNCNLPTSTFRKGAVIGDQAASSTFDDYVLYHSQMNESNARLSDTPKGMILPFTNMAVCPTGWTAYGTAPGTGTGVSPPPLTAPNNATTAGTCNQPAGGVCCQKI